MIELITQYLSKFIHNFIQENKKYFIIFIIGLIISTVILMIAPIRIGIGTRILLWSMFIAYYFCDQFKKTRKELKEYREQLYKQYRK